MFMEKAFLLQKIVDIDVEEDEDDDLLDLVERNVEVLLFSLKLYDNKLVGIDDGIDIIPELAVEGGGVVVVVVIVVLSNNEVLMTVFVDSMDVFLFGVQISLSMRIASNKYSRLSCMACIRASHCAATSLSNSMQDSCKRNNATNGRRKNT
ncbi:hypothetical protein FF38_05268 [Lucilia cuprina]|uniref:Uncharacterized protein n=1 Tax=Lucilia cuprina TaxID=7375 RepID=A0A0L0BXM1_LUCCU|nr:hypothetical protein FF38_05268 [Lucilia cuprina]